jgi:sec-independent protein translocase protein TatA
MSTLTAFSFRGRRMDLMSPIHWLVVIGIAVLLFGGRGKLSGIMSDFAKGIKAFKSGIKDKTVPDAPPSMAQPDPAVHAVEERPRERV